MQPKTAVIILCLIMAIVGLFFVYLYFSGNLSIITSINNPPEEKQTDLPKTKSEIISDLMESAKKNDTSTSTPEEKTIIIKDLMESAKKNDTSTSTPEEKSEIIRKMMEQAQQP